MKMLEIKITKGVLFLTEGELESLLARDRELWKRAIYRGKWSGVHGPTRPGRTG